MKKVTKIFALLMVLVSVAVALTACSKGTCESCGKENVTLKSVTVDGKKAKVCEDCKEIIEALVALGTRIGR